MKIRRKIYAVLLMFIFSFFLYLFKNPVDNLNFKLYNEKQSGCEEMSRCNCCSERGRMVKVPLSTIGSCLGASV